MVRHRGVAACDAEVADHRAGLLRQPGLIESSHLQSGEHRGGAEHLTDGDHPGAADAGEPHREVVGVDQTGRRRRKIARGSGRRRARRVGLAFDGHRGERRAVALQAREVEVAAGLVDAGLASVGRVDRLDRQAIALVAAVAAALAHPLVDHHPEARCGDRATRPSASVLRGAGLVVDVHGDTRGVGEDALGIVEPAAVPHLD